MPTPLYVEATFALPQTHSSFPSTLRLETRSCGYGLLRKKPEPLLPRKAGTSGLPKTLSGRRILASAGPSSTKGAINHQDDEDPSSIQGISRTIGNEEQIALPHHLKKSLPEAKHHRPRSQSFSSVVLSPPLPPPVKHYLKLPIADQTVFLLGSVTFMVCGAFIALLATAIPTLNAMKRAAVSLERLADTARDELPGTMAAIRLSGMEISDLTLELSDLSQEVSESVRSSARAVRAAEVGIRRMGSAAASQTLSLLQEHASVPVEAVKPVVVTAAETTRHAMSQAHKAVLGLAGMPVLSKWIQRKKIEEQTKIDEDMGLESNSELCKQGETEILLDS